MGREGMSRRHALYKMVSLVQGTNIVRKELGVPVTESLAADPRVLPPSGRTINRMRAAIVGLGWWGKALVESVQDKSAITRGAREVDRNFLNEAYQFNFPGSSRRIVPSAAVPPDARSVAT